MPEPRTVVAALAVVMAGGLAACGGSSSGSGASKKDFCATFDHLGSRTDPRQAADQLSRTGTPSDIDSDARQGFQVLVDHLRDLPAGSTPGRISQMVHGLNAQDAADVRDFITYYARECQGLEGGSS